MATALSLRQTGRLGVILVERRASAARAFGARLGEAAGGESLSPVVALLGAGREAAVPNHPVIRGASAGS